MAAIRQSTTRTILVGPVLDADGVAKTNEVVANIRVTKNGTVGSANGSTTLTHDHAGKYKLAMATGDSDTVGVLEVSLNSGTNDMPVCRLNVVEEAVYDAMYAVSAAGPLQSATAGRKLTVSANGEGNADLTFIYGTALSETSGGYLAAAFVKLLDVATPLLVASDVMVGTDGASTHSPASVWAVDATGQQTQGTFGQAIGDPGAIAKSLWQATVSDASGASVSADVIAIKTETVLIVADTDELQTNQGAWATATSVTVSDKAGFSLSSTGLDLVTAWTTSITGNLSGSVGSVSGAVGSVAGNVDGTVASVVTKTGYSLVSTGLNLVLVDGKTLPAAIQIIGATTSGIISGAGTGTEICKGLDGATTRVTATVDGSGNRSGMAYS